MAKGVKEKIVSLANQSFDETRGRISGTIESGRKARDQ